MSKNEVPGKGNRATAPTVTIELDMDNFTWGDLEDIESQSPTKVRQAMQKFASIEGVAKEEMSEYLRRLSLREMKEISNQFMQAVMALSNPSANGKN